MPGLNHSPNGLRNVNNTTIHYVWGDFLRPPHGTVTVVKHSNECEKGMLRNYIYRIVVNSKVDTKVGARCSVFGRAHRCSTVGFLILQCFSFGLRLSTHLVSSKY